MNVIHPRCAAIDIGKDLLVTAVRVQQGTLVHLEGVTDEVRDTPEETDDLAMAQAKTP